MPISILHYFSFLAQHIVKQVAIFGVCEKELCGSRDMRPFPADLFLHTHLFLILYIFGAKAPGTGPTLG